MARAMGAELFLMRAVGVPAGLPPDAFRASPTALVEQWHRDAVLDLERLAATLDTELVVHVLARIGNPWSAICAAAREHDVNLVVVGSHGYEGVDHLIGTTAAKVVNHADCSVFVVREPHAPKAG